MGGCGEGLAFILGVNGEPMNCEDGFGEATAMGPPVGADEKGGFKQEGDGEGTLPARLSDEQGSGDGLVTDEGCGEGMLETDDGRGEGTLETDDGRGDGFVTVEG